MSIIKSRRALMITARLLSCPTLGFQLEVHVRECVNKSTYQDYGLRSPTYARSQSACRLDDGFRTHGCVTERDFEENQTLASIIECKGRKKLLSHFYAPLPVVNLTKRSHITLVTMRSLHVSKTQTDALK